MLNNLARIDETSAAENFNILVDIASDPVAPERGKSLINLSTLACETGIKLKLQLTANRLETPGLETPESAWNMMADVSRCDVVEQIGC